MISSPPGFRFHVWLFIESNWTRWYVRWGKVMHWLIQKSSSVQTLFQNKFEANICSIVVPFVTLSHLSCLQFSTFSVSLNSLNTQFQISFYTREEAPISRFHSYQVTKKGWKIIRHPKALGLVSEESIATNNEWVSKTQICSLFSPSCFLGSSLIPSWFVSRKFREKLFIEILSDFPFLPIRSRVPKNPADVTRTHKCLSNSQQKLRRESETSSRKKNE